MRKTIDRMAAEAYIPLVTQGTTMTGSELSALMTAAGLLGQEGAEALATRLGISWRTVFRWRARETKPLSRMATESIRRALATTQDHSRRVRPAARKSKQLNNK